VRKIKIKRIKTRLRFLNIAIFPRMIYIRIDFSMVSSSVSALFIANAINLGADLGAIKNCIK
jgi:hypothetical protein